MALIPASPNLGTGPTNQQGPFPQTGSTTPTGQIIGPLPASTMPGQLAQTIPVMANFQFLLSALNSVASQIVPPGAIVNPVSITGTPPINVSPTPITGAGNIGHDLSGVVAGQYGDALDVAQITVDHFGHVTKLTNVPIAATGGFIQADYVLFPVSNAGLTNDRLLTAGTNITIVDGGAKGPVTINATGINGSGWLFGDGSDGAFTADGAATPAWATLAANVYTMTRNCYCTTLTVNSGIRIIGASFQIFCNVALVGVNATTSIISNNGHDASGFNGGGNITAGTLPGTAPGGGGSNGSNGGPGTGRAVSLGGSGGKGGDFSPNVGGAGGVATIPSATQSSLHGAANIYSAITQRVPPEVSAQIYFPGSGGGGGSGDALHSGGGGGGSAGFLVIFARTISGLGKFTAIGGGGANGTGANSSGGGGGGGGAMWIVTTTANWNTFWSTDVSGGAKGLLTGAGGNDGVVGVAGNVFPLIVT